MAKKLTVLCAAKLHANQLERHMELFDHIPEVEKVIVVRHEGIGTRLDKVENRPFGSASRGTNAVNMYRAISRILTHEKVDWVLGFNPVPWGTIAATAARRRGVPNCLSLIGMDFLQVQRWWGRPFLNAVRKADAITVTGKRMTDGLVACGVEPERIFVLPHSIDMGRFSPSDQDKQFDIISVGQLITRKRMDVLIDAISELAQRGTRLRLGILGKGELEGELRARAQASGVADLVEFLGYRDDVEAVLKSAKVFSLASEWEGVPFAMMEAMASGLVPVVTNVGTIGDWISEDNGRLVPVGDVRVLADTWQELFADDEAVRKQLARTVLEQRELLNFETGARVWRQILRLD